MSNRRDFLTSATSLAATAAVGRLAGAPVPPAASLPMVRFGGVEISRLVIGSNQFYGVSHFNAAFDRMMAEWNTPERVCQTLLQCQQQGINAYQHVQRVRQEADLDLFRRQGGNMHLIAVDIEMERSVEQTMKRNGAGALYHHGEITDVLFRNRQMDKAQEYCKKLRQAGVQVGVGTHKPEVVEFVEEHGWDVDFYVLCAYNRTRTPEEIRQLLGVLPVPASELYLETDPPRAYEVARKTPKTCFLFKVLAAGRSTQSPEDVDKAFKLAFDSIKPQDCIIVGMYPRFRDEVKENCDRVRRMLTKV